MSQPENIVFVVSTGRTGTVSIARELNRIGGGLVALHEPRFSRLLRIAGNAYACDQLSERCISALLRASVGRRITRFTGRTYVEVSPFLRTMIGPLSQMYPSARFAHIVRHPASYIMSYAGHGAFDGFKGFAGHRIPFWLLKPEDLERKPSRRWGEMPPPMALAWRWVTLNSLIQAHATNLGNRYARFRFEDLFGSASGMTPLLSWIAPEWCGERRSDAAAPANASRRTATASRIADRGIDPDMIKRICSPLADRYGYDTEKVSNPSTNRHPD